MKCLKIHSKFAVQGMSWQGNLIGRDLPDSTLTCNSVFAWHKNKWSAYSARIWDWQHPWPGLKLIYDTMLKLTKHAPNCANGLNISYVCACLRVLWAKSLYLFYSRLKTARRRSKERQIMSNDESTCCIGRAANCLVTDCPVIHYWKIST